MTVTINGTTGIDKVQSGVVTSSSLASGQTLAVNGIAFPSGQVASSDANTLDDYEEGTWTPNVGGNATYSHQRGSYVKVGKTVTINFDMWISTIGTGSTSYLYGLPFTSANDALPKTGCVSYYSGLSVSPVFIAFYADANNTTCQFVWNTGASSTIGVNAGSLWTSGSRLLGSISYKLET